MRAIGYFAETARRKGNRRSVGEQNQAFLDFCSRFGYEVAGAFLDTEDEATRPGGFEQMLGFLARPDRGFTVVVVDSLRALGPDLGVAALKLLELEQAGAPVLLAGDGADAFKSLVDTWADRGDGTPVSEKVRSAMRRKAVKGEVLGRPPYGYRVGARRRLELVPEEAVVVRYIIRLYLQEGMGIRKIAGQLNSENVPTRRGGRWSMVTVRDILRNRAYLGHYSRFGTTVTGSHPALVSPDDFRRVQDRLQSHHGADADAVPSNHSCSAGWSIVRAAATSSSASAAASGGRTRSGEVHSAQYRYYQCESRTNQNACAYNTQRAAELEERILCALAEDEAPLTRVRRAGNVDSYVLDLITQVDRVESRLKRNRRQVEELVADAAHGHLTIERMKTLGGALAQEHQALAAELDAARTRLQAHQSEADRRAHLDALRQELAAGWRETPFEQLQAGLREVIDRAEVDGKDLRVFLRA